MAPKRESGRRHLLQEFVDLRGIRLRFEDKPSQGAAAGRRQLVRARSPVTSDTEQVFGFEKRHNQFVGEEASPSFDPE